MASAALKRPASPGVSRIQNFDLQGTIQYQKDCIRNRQYDVLGRLTNLSLGIDDNAEYFRGKAWERVSRTSKAYGLQLEWDQKHAPWIGFCPDKQTCIFPSGIQHLPSVVPSMLKDFRPASAHATAEQPRMPQRLSDYSSGRLMDVRGEKGFVILQPVLACIIFSHVAGGTLLKLKGAPVLGRHPFLMVNPFGPEAYIAGGGLSFF
jgi:hypothetical protein